MSRPTTGKSGVSSIQRTSSVRAFGRDLAQSQKIAIAASNTERKHSSDGLSKNFYEDSFRPVYEPMKNSQSSPPPPVSSALKSTSIQNSLSKSYSSYSSNNNNNYDNSGNNYAYRQKNVDSPRISPRKTNTSSYNSQSNSELESLRGQISLLESSNEQFQSRLDSMYRDFSQALNRQQAAFQFKLDQVVDSQNSISRDQNHSNSLQMKCKTMEQQLRQLENLFNTMQRQNDSGQVARLEKMVDRLGSQVTSLEQQIQQQSSVTSQQSRLQNQLNTIQSKVVEIENKLYDQEKQVSVYNIPGLHKAMAKLQTEYSTIEQNQEFLNQKMTKLDALAKQVKQLQTSLENGQSQYFRNASQSAEYDDNKIFEQLESLNEIVRKLDERISLSEQKLHEELIVNLKKIMAQISKLQSGTQNTEDSTQLSQVNHQEITKLRDELASIRKQVSARGISQPDTKWKDSIENRVKVLENMVHNVASTVTADGRFNKIQKSSSLIATVSEPENDINYGKRSTLLSPTDAYSSMKRPSARQNEAASRESLMFIGSNYALDQEQRPTMGSDEYLQNEPFLEDLDELDEGHTLVNEDQMI
ncbi:hypothetical protein MIR68_006381 [Amoeboaphelidium protococcarum]|nr:hypothetical protein MIR68_006381 [Amoeboaphelidium protococcarum]